MSSPHIIAVAGGSCSGKTTLVKTLLHHLGDETCAILYQDSYYRGLADITNFDTPEAIEFELMAEHLRLLKRGQAVATPTYDFNTHRRLPETQTLAPKPIILVDGILILHAPELANCFDYKVFVECEQEQRLARRLCRDVRERGRTEQDTLAQFHEQVAPLHDLYVEPSKHHADLICTNNYPPSAPMVDISAPLTHYCQQHLQQATAKPCG